MAFVLTKLTETQDLTLSFFALVPFIPSLCAGMRFPRVGVEFNPWFSPRPLRPWLIILTSRPVRKVTTVSVLKESQDQFDANFGIEDIGGQKFGSRFELNFSFCSSACCKFASRCWSWRPPSPVIVPVTGRFCLVWGAISSFPRGGWVGSTPPSSARSWSPAPPWPTFRRGRGRGTTWQTSSTWRLSPVRFTCSRPTQGWVKYVTDFTIFIFSLAGWMELHSCLMLTRSKGAVTLAQPPRQGVLEVFQILDPFSVIALILDEFHQFSFVSIYRLFGFTLCCTFEGPRASGANQCIKKLLRKKPDRVVAKSYYKQVSEKMLFQYIRAQWPLYKLHTCPVSTWTLLASLIVPFPGFEQD